MEPFLRLMRCTMGAFGLLGGHSMTNEPWVMLLLLLLLPLQPSQAWG